MESRLEYGLVEIRSRNGGPPLFARRAAKAYQIELRLVMGVKQFAESQRFAHSV